MFISNILSDSDILKIHKITFVNPEKKKKSLKLEFD